MKNKEKRLKFAKRLKRIRIDKGFSQTELAKKLGYWPSNISRHEVTGEFITLCSAWKLADILGVTIDQLVGREDIHEKRD